MADNTENEQEYPDTWGQLRERFPELEGFPDLMSPALFTPEQSAKFALVTGRVNDSLRDITRLAAGKKQTHEYDTTVPVGEIIIAADQLCAELTTDKDGYEQWSRGRSAMTLVQAYLEVLRFMDRLLGKSDGSRTHTGNAR